MDDLLVLRDGRLPGGSTTVDVVVGDGRVVAVRPAGGVPARADVPDVALDGRTVVPGLWDMHAHLTQWALARGQVDLVAATSAREAVDLVGRELATRPPGDAPPGSADAGDLLVCRRMRSATWPDVPHRTLLDLVAPTTPVMVQNIDLHLVWCNSAALRLFGRPDDPTGVLREADCYRILEALTDRATASQDALVAAALTEAAARGVVGIKDFEFGDALPDWQRRSRAGRLPVRIDTTVYRSHLDGAIERGWPTGTVVPDTNGLVRTGHLKVFVDGALNSGTALCHHPVVAGLPVIATPPHDDEVELADHGHLATAPADLQAVLARAWQHGIAPAVHAIGDRAVTIALDAFDHVGCPGRIEHAQLVADADLPRFARPGLVASVQPAHCTDDRDVTDDRWSDRSHRAYRFADLAAAGARLEFGSDAPVSALDPWAAIAAAVTRTDDDRPSWHPEQCLDVATALAASARGRERVHAGDPADLVICDDDPTTCTVDVLRAGPVAATMVAGRWTHGRRALGG